MHIFIYSCFIIVGVGLLVKGADFFVDGAAGIALRLGIPQLIIGLTIVAMGTSAPEAAVSITAAISGNADITIGNIVGSNILNTFIILGLSSVIIPLAVAKSTVIVEIPYMIVSSILFLLLGYDKKMNFLDGGILWIAFIIYLIYLFRNAKKNKEKEPEGQHASGIRQMLYIIGGLIAIILGSKITVYGATEIARLVGISERFIGLTIVALGTSLPELFTSVAAARKGNADIAIGNIVGSNIFNILFIVGTTSFIRTISFDTKFMVDSVVVILSGVLLLLCVCPSRRLSRRGGSIMLLCYLAYFIYLCLV